MSAHVAEHETLCAGYALGTLDAPSHERIVSHLAAGCDTCGDVLDDLNDALAIVARSAAPVAPPAELRAEVLADAPVVPVAPKVRAQAAGSPTGRLVPANEGGDVAIRTMGAMTWPGWIAVWVAACLAIGLVASRNEASRLRSQLTETKGLLARLSETLTDGVLWGGIIAAPGTRVALLEPAAGTRAPRGWVTSDPASGHAVALFRDATPPDGRTYVLWAVAGTRWTRIAGLDADAGGRATVRATDTRLPPGLTAFAISLEPVGAPSVAPAGPVVVSGTIGDRS